MSKQTKFKVIGDIHSRSHLLKEALEDNPQYSPIFLGDILDGRNSLAQELKTANDLATLELVLPSLYAGGQLIIGNHDYNLYYSADRSKLTTNTKDRLARYALFTEFINAIKYSRPYLELVVGETVYNLAHAYPYKSASCKEQIWGPRTAENKRYKWYNNPPVLSDVVKVCGHYHQIIYSKNIVVLDGDNKIDNCLPVLLINGDGSNLLLKYD